MTLFVVCVSSFFGSSFLSLISYLSGYKNLYDRGILHRDVSVNNLLIGKPGASAPNRGVIIDLDMSIELSRTRSLKDIDFKTVSSTLRSSPVVVS